LCRDDVAIDRSLDPRRIPGLSLASPAVAESDDVRSAAAVLFTTAKVQLRLRDPVAKAALVRLAGAWPLSLSFAELGTAVAETLGAAPEGAALAVALLRCFLCDMLELGLAPEPIAAFAPERPCARPLARACAARGLPVATLRHERAELDDDERRM